MQFRIESVRGRLAGLVVASAAVTIAAAQQGIPVLRFDPPANFSRSAITPPEDYSSNEFAASVQIYPFRPFSGNIQQMFQRTLLRDWIDPRYRETNVAGQPELRPGNVQGSQNVTSARFAENIAGIPRQHLRMLIVAGGAAAIVDASANNLATWQRALPALNAFGGSLRVETEAAPPAVTGDPGPEGRAIAGLYMGTKPKYMPDLIRGVGYGNWVRSPHYYLFSADGRVYRAFDQLNVPGGDPSRFDFNAAQRADPVNSGRYVLTGNQIRIQMGGRPPETIVAPAPKDGRVTIETIVYVRQ